MIDNVGLACCGCTACAASCPAQCIKMKENSEGFYYPVIEEESCVHCGRCEAVCPVLSADNGKKTEDLKEAYGAICGDEQVLMRSSSGGLFTVLSEAVLSVGGCVYGAAFTEDFSAVHHIRVENKEELVKLCGSKYVQSAMEDCFKDVREQLESGRCVLFSGTPCQTAALKKFLSRDYDNLLLVDVICHGVPSPLLWKRYLNHVESQLDGKAAYVSFRHKENGWRDFGMNIPQQGGQRYYKTLREDPFLRMFLKNLCLRESCYRCKIKETGTLSDITIGDFWGVEQAEPTLDSSLGVSLVLIHTAKGQALFDKVKPELQQVKKVAYTAAIAKNSAMEQSVSRPSARNRFFQILSRWPWDTFEKKSLQDRMSVRLKSKLLVVIRMIPKRKRDDQKYPGGGIRDNGFRYGLLIIADRKE